MFNTSFAAPHYDLSVFPREDQELIAEALDVQNFKNMSEKRLLTVLRQEQETTADFVNTVIHGLVTSDKLEFNRARPVTAEARTSTKKPEAPAAKPLTAKEVWELIKTPHEEVTKGLMSTAVDAMDERFKGVEERLERFLADRPLRVEVQHVDANRKPVAPVIALGLQHHKMPTLLKMIKARVNVLLVGPAGSGKTTAAEACAKALGLEFHFNGAIDTEYKLKGFIDAHGNMRETAFRKAYEFGGVYLFDEIDASLPAATMAFNAALANGFCDFADKMVHRHPDFICIAAGNTYMTGATFDYVGRNKQDAAFVDRFASLTWPIDEKLEAAITPNAQWVREVQRLRANAATKGLKVIISPRASLHGAKLIEAGLSWEEALETCVRKGMTDTQWMSISR